MVSVPSVVEERTPSGEAHAVRDRELRVRSTRHWENNIVTRPLEKLLAISQKSEKKCQKQMHPGKQHSSQSVWLLVLAEAGVEALEQHGAGQVAVGRTVSPCCSPR